MVKDIGRVIKRNGRVVDWDHSKVSNAIRKAMEVTKIGVDEDLLADLVFNVESFFVGKNNINVESIQDKIAELLMGIDRPKLVETFITYRNQQVRERGKHHITSKALTDDFLSNFKHNKSTMDQLGSFVYYRTYSRFIDELSRRENWWETVDRAVSFNTKLVPTTIKETRELYDAVFNHNIFLSGRTLWVGNTQIDNPMANFNCSFAIADNFDFFSDLFYLLLIGSGVGLRILPSDVAKLPSVTTNKILFNEEYEPKDPEDRLDHTDLIYIDNTTALLRVGDSKEGWVDALDYYLKLLYSSRYEEINKIVVNYNNVRQKGEKLETFGGTASGHTSVKTMFKKIHKLVKKRGEINSEKKTKLEPIDCLDIATIIGENVLSGGVRRTAEMILLGPDDKESIEAKNDLYKQIDGQWIMNDELSHRQVANNSIYYEEKPDREQMHWQIKQMKNSGEPAFINAEAAKKRFPDFNGVNPCGEILLDTKGLCNLTTLNVKNYVIDGVLDKEALFQGQRLSVRAGYRLTQLDLELPYWDNTHKANRVVGASLTGWQDMVNLLDLTKDQEAELLRELREVAHEELEKYSDELGDQMPHLVTTVKPEGTQSQVAGTSSGLHFAHSPYYLRRVRITSDDPLIKVCEELDYNVYPEVGQDLETCVTKVVEFPVKAPKGRTKYDVSAIEQLEVYKMFMENYVDHNASITVHVRDHEWELVEEWLWENWDSVIGVTFISLDDSFYELLPYESISEEEYIERKANMREFVPSLITKYENSDGVSDISQSEECESGICPIR